MALCGTGDLAEIMVLSAGDTGMAVVCVIDEDRAGLRLAGSTLIDLLLARGDDVPAIDNFATGRRDNRHPRLRLVEGSIVEAAVVNRLIGDCRPDVVIHTAASYKDPDNWEADALTNCVGGADVARACKTHKVGRLIYCQTALCYGRPERVPIPVDHPTAPFTSYGISKTAGEAYLAISGLPYY